MRPFALFLSTAFVTGALLASSAGIAATYNVTRFDDPVPALCTAMSCSLREAIARSNSNPGTDRIALPAGTYALTRVDNTPYTLEAGIGALWVTESVLIYGAGASTTRVQWVNAPHQPFGIKNQIIAVNQAAQVSLELRDLALSDGRGPNGGCLRMFGASPKPHQLKLQGTRFERCQTLSNGGAIQLGLSSVTMQSAVFQDNSADYDGGAISFLADATVVTSGVSISKNSARNGGAIQILGNPVPSFVEVMWSDDGSLRIEGNSAVAGGAIGIFLGTLVMESTQVLGSGNWIQISGNSAQQGGAVRINSLQPDPIASFSGVRFLRNSAQSGGAFYSNSPIQISDAEFTGNKANAGDGGAIALVNSSLQSLPSTFERVSFRDNVATGGGGAVFSGCGGFSADNVSFGGNGAGSTRGQAIENTGPGQLRHATLHNNVHATNPISSPGIQQLSDASCSGAFTQMRLANSLITDYCGFNIPRLVSDGGNQFGPNAGVCPANASDARQSSAGVFGLVNGSFGGPLEFWGWNANQLVPQHNFGLAANCSATDIRGIARTDGLCDSGAYEQP
jgi:predicted outer membrane repeat protein